MKRAIGAFLVFGFLFLGSKGLKANTDARIRALESAVTFLTKQLNDKRMKSEYPVTDQHDTVSLLLSEALTDIGLNRIEKEGHQTQLHRLKDAFEKGGVTLEALESAELQVKLDDLSEQGLGFKKRMFETKLTALKCLQADDCMGFLSGDSEGSRAGKAASIGGRGAGQSKKGLIFRSQSRQNAKLRAY